MKTHYGHMLDRHVATGEVILRVQRENGAVIDVHVDPQHEAAAGELWGGGGLSFAYRGRQAYYVPREIE